MAAVVQVQPHDGVAGLQEGGVNGAVGGRAAEGLHIDVEVVGRYAIGGKQFGSAAAGERLQQIGIFDAFVIARVAITAVMGQFQRHIHNVGFALAAALFAGVAFGVDVGKGAAHGRAYRIRRGALTGNQDDAALLPPVFCF